MTAKRFNGKAIYQPTGKAAEYSPWACNFYTGCSNDCEYCYCKRGVMSHVWSTEPRLKKCFKDENHALDVFKNELNKARLDHASIKERGILFSFTTDPMIPGKTLGLTLEAMITAVVTHRIPAQILTKRADWLDRDTWKRTLHIWKRYASLIAFGFTLTGHDDLEPGASSNMERLQAMKRLHEMGFKTFASIEPVVDFPSAFSMINLSQSFCDLHKIGLMSGKRYNRQERSEAEFLLELLKETPGKYYLKDSLIKLLEIDRAELPSDKFVNSDYNIFND